MKGFTGHKHSIATKQKISNSHKGLKLSLETRRKLSDFRKGKPAWNRGLKGTQKANSGSFQKGDIRISGANSQWWKGGVTPLHKKIRQSIEYKNWRTAVYKRDNFTCILCGEKGNGKNLNADHIKPFAYFPELRLDINNGRTLCIPCHQQTPTFSGRVNIALRIRDERGMFI